jgi:NADH-quinone oxidoreductase subunit C
VSAGLLSRLESLMSTSEASDYAACGYHHKHQAERDQILAIAEAGASAGYILEMLTCEDRREDAQAMRLCYAFNAIAAVDRHLVQVDIAAASETDLSYSAPTITGVYGAADWFEREVFDMYGVVFDDHPDLERILLPEDADFFALRRDFGRMDEAEDAGQEEAEASDE